jgi:hypothetical protein
VDCELNQNTANTTAGAIYLFSASANIQRCAFADNTAVDGGALRNQGGRLTVEHSTFFRNLASARGGVLIVSGTDPITSIIHSTMSGNQAPWRVRHRRGLVFGRWRVRAGQHHCEWKHGRYRA